ncbi:MAG: hypothetical protein WCP22_00285 [Chlamydiota bacterium]
MKRTPAVALLFCACALSAASPASKDEKESPPGESVRGASSPADAHYRRGLALRMSLRYDAALDEFRAATVLLPGHIPAHREYQNLMLDLGFQEELARDYGAAVRRNPGDPALRYLYGRLLDDPSSQDREFARVIALDPRFPWGHYGRAMNLLGRGDREGAEEEIAAALDGDRLFMQARIAKAHLESLAGRRERALQLYRELLRDEDAPGELFAAALSECQALDRTDEGAAISAIAAARFPGSPPLAAYRGYFLARGGDRAGAVEWYENAARAGPLPFVFAQDLRRLYADSGLHGKAVGLWRSLFGMQLSAEDNRLLPLWRRVEETARAAPPGAGPAAFAALAESYEAMGWWAEAASVRRAEGGDAARGGPLAADAEGVKVLDALGRYGKWLDSGTRRRSPRISFPRAVGELTRVTAEAAGRPVVLPGSIRSLAGVRWFGDATGRPQPLLDALRGGNREIIFFENVCARRMTFEVAEVIRCALRRGDARGPFHWETTCCPSGSGVMEGESGLAYPPFTGLAVFYDPSRWSDLCESRGSRRRDPLGHSWFLDETGRGPLGPREVLFSRMLEKRLFEKVCRSISCPAGEPIEARIEDRYAELVAAHERLHLGDLRRFLPVSKHPARCIGLAARALFSPRRIERWFEERATVCSLARGGDPSLWLLTVHAQLAGATGAHRDACRRVLDAIVGRVASRPGAFPGIDGRKNILNQLYLLDAETLRAVVRELYGEGE